MHHLREKFQINVKQVQGRGGSHDGAGRLALYRKIGKNVRGLSTAGKCTLINIAELSVG